MKIKLENSELYKKAILDVIESEEFICPGMTPGEALRRVILLETDTPRKVREGMSRDVFRYIDSRYGAVLDAVSEAKLDLWIHSAPAWFHLMPLDALDDMAQFLMGEEFNEGREND